MSSHPDQASSGGVRPGGSLPAQGAMPGPVPPASPADAGAQPGVAGGMPGSGPLRSAWKTGADGRTTFRLIPPLVLWWAWVVFALANVADLGIQSHDWFSVQVSAAIATVTGVMYACAVRPKVISDSGGITIRNPFRDFFVPWGAVTGVFVGDSVEVGCQRRAPKPEKTVYSWALYSPRRARARAELRTGFGSRKARDRHDMRARRRFEVDASAFGRMPQQAREIASQHPSHVMAGEIARRWDAARQAEDVPAAVMTARWAWVPIAAVIVPAAALIAVIVTR